MKKILISLFSSLFLFSAVQAGQFGVGVTGSVAAIGASGSEADKSGAADTSVRTAEASHNAMIGSIFAEYQMDNGFALGVDYIPGSADVNSKKLTRTDATADGAEAVQDDGDRTAAAEISKVITVFAEIPVHAGLYLKGGYTEMDVTALESSTITTTGKYGTETIGGTMFGLGFRNSFGSNGFYKVEGTHTMFDTATFASSITDAGNRISADLDVTKATFAIGYTF